MESRGCWQEMCFSAKKRTYFWSGKERHLPINIPRIVRRWIDRSLGFKVEGGNNNPLSSLQKKKRKEKEKKRKEKKIQSERRKILENVYEEVSCRCRTSLKTALKNQLSGMYTITINDDVVFNWNLLTAPLLQYNYVQLWIIILLYLTNGHK